MSKCRNCGTELEHVFCDLGHHALANSYLTEEQINGPEVTYPLRPMVCHECFLVQVRPHAQPEDVFREYAYFSGQSQGWVNHCAEYATSIWERFYPNKVLEIASNDGTFLNSFYTYQGGLQVLGVEPARNVAWRAQLDGVPTIDEFFGVGLAVRLRESGFVPDVIVANNVLAHVPDFDDFLGGVRELLPDDGVAVFEFPHLVRLIEDNAWDTIYHEHYSYFSFRTVCDVFRRRRLRVFDVEEHEIHCGSLRVFVTHWDSRKHGPTQPYAAMLRREAGMNAVGDVVSDVNYHSLGSYRLDPAREKVKAMEIIAYHADHGGISAYGAAAKLSTFLSYCGIGPELIPFVVDSTPEKIGKYTPGSHIPILSVDALTEHKPQTILIGPHNWAQEIEHKIHEQCDWDPTIIYRPFV